MTDFQKGIIAAQNMNFVLLKALIEQPQSRRYAFVDIVLSPESQLIDDYLNGKSVDFKNGFEQVVNQTADLDNFLRRWLANRLSEGIADFGGFVVDT